jgi:hypothetical protein
MLAHKLVNTNHFECTFSHRYLIEQETLHVQPKPPAPDTKSTRVILSQAPMHDSDLAYKLSMLKHLSAQRQRAYAKNQRFALHPEHEIPLVSTCLS